MTYRLDHRNSHGIPNLAVQFPPVIDQFESIGETHDPIALLNRQFPDPVLVPNPKPTRRLLRRQCRMNALGRINPVRLLMDTGKVLRARPDTRLSNFFIPVTGKNQP